MQLSDQLQKKVKTIAHKYGIGWDGDDLTQDCFVMIYSPDFPDYSDGQILKACHNLCINKLKAQEVRASSSIDFEPLLYGETVDVEKYIEHIKDLRLGAIADQVVDGERPLSSKDRFYLYYHRGELDRDMRKYLKQKSAWQILIDKIEPFKRSLRKLKDQSVRAQMLRTQ